MSGPPPPPGHSVPPGPGVPPPPPPPPADPARAGYQPSPQHAPHPGVAASPWPAGFAGPAGWDAPAPPQRPLHLGRVALAWLAAFVVLQLLGYLSGWLFLTLGDVVGFRAAATASFVIGFVVGLLVVGVAVAVLAARGGAAGRPWWHWVVAAVPPLVLGDAVSMVLQVVHTGSVYRNPVYLVFLVVEPVVAAGLAVGLGAVLRRSAEARTRRLVPPPAH